MFVFAVVWLENNFICLCKGGVGWYKTKWRPFPSHHSRTSIIWLTTSGTPSGSSGFIALKIQVYENIPYFQVYFVHCFVQVSIPSFRALQLDIQQGLDVAVFKPCEKDQLSGRKGGGKGRGRRVRICRETPGWRNFTDIHSVSSEVSFKGFYWAPKAPAIHSGIYMQRFPLGAKV